MNGSKYGFWRRQWHPTPVLLPGKSHGRRSLVGCSPWGRWGSDMTERLHFHFLLACIGEGNGNPLQCSCLENPGDGGAWWAAISGVAQSWTWLKWLSSSSYLLLDGKNKSFVNFIMLLTQQWNLQIHSFTPIFWIWSVTTELLNCSEILGINKGLCWQQKLQAWYFLCW